MARKSLCDFVHLAKSLMGRARLWLMGLTAIGCRCLKAIEAQLRTESRRELVEAYSAADDHLNLTRENNYPMVKLEAEVHKAFAVTNGVGGCSEAIHNSCSRAVTGCEGMLELHKVRGLSLKASCDDEAELGVVL